MGTSRAAAQKCPYCKEKLDAMSSIDEDESLPRKGDITVCIYCAEILIIDDELKLRIPTNEELVDIYKTNPEIDDIRRLVINTMMGIAR